MTNVRDNMNMLLNFGSKHLSILCIDKDFTPACITPLDNC